MKFSDVIQSVKGLDSKDIYSRLDFMNNTLNEELGTIKQNVNLNKELI
jgi:hypothetical protein